VSKLDHLLERNFGTEVPKPGLSRCVALRERIRERADFNVAVVGTNGKGSFVHTFGLVCRQWGYDVLQFTSPHVHTVRERILWNGEMLGESQWSSWLAELQNYSQEIQGITYFEAIWGVALLAVRDLRPDVVLWEAGLGGRLDAINALENFDLCVLTQVGLDHTALLGDDPTGIALEKLAVARRNAPVVIGDIEACDRDRLSNRLRKIKAVWVEDLPQQQWVQEGYKSFKDALSDDHLSRILTLAVIHSKLGQFGDLAFDQISRPAYRLDRTRKPLCFDVAHNPDSVARLCKSVAGGSVFVGNFLARKDLSGIVDVLVREMQQNQSFSELFVALLPGFHNQETWEAALQKYGASAKFLSEKELQGAVFSDNELSIGNHKIVLREPDAELWISGSFQCIQIFENLLQN
jgi:folylpolyglutamate synthase/dihydrofolate synthase